MGRIVATVDVQNVAEPRLLKKIDTRVDTGASCVTLPSAWKERFGAFGSPKPVASCRPWRTLRHRAVDGGSRTGVSGGPPQAGQAGSFQGS